jgi:hypothetical protein
VKSLVARGLPTGAFVEVTCSGRGCAFKLWRSPKISSGTPCHTRKCRSDGLAISHGELDLAKLFKAKHLAVGAHITVSIAQAGWIGKRFVFLIEKNRTPSVAVNCLTPGSASTTDQC